MGIEIEKRHRINVSLWAYAYEVMDDPLVSDDQYDRVSRSINLSLKTGRLDDFFANEFDPSTGIWIYKHPEIDRLAAIYGGLTGKRGIVPKDSIDCSVPVTNSAAKCGFKRHSDVKLYLAYLGFRVIDDWQRIGYRLCHFEYDKDFVHITDIDTKESKSIYYRDIFKSERWTKR